MEFVTNALVVGLGEGSEALGFVVPILVVVIVLVVGVDLYLGMRRILKRGLDDRKTD